MDSCGEEIGIGLRRFFFAAVPAALLFWGDGGTGRPLGIILGVLALAFLIAVIADVAAAIGDRLRRARTNNDVDAAGGEG